ncbi:hypothetical protein [Hymenobacter algoricola]
MLPGAFLTFYNNLFKDNDEFLIKEADFRKLASDLADNVVFWSKLSALGIRGGLLPLQHLGELTTQSPGVLVVGQLANVAYDTDAATLAALLAAGPLPATLGSAQYKLIRDTTGNVDAFTDAKPETTTRVKARWVKVSGSEDEKIASYPTLQLEDYPVKKGDVVQYLFPDNKSRLLEILRDLPLAGAGSFNPTPTGLDTDLNYKSFAPLQGGTTLAQLIGLLNITQSHATTLEQAANGKLPAGCLLRIVKRSPPNANPQLPDVLVPAYSARALATEEAYIENADGTISPVVYNLATNQTTARGATTPASIYRNGQVIPVPVASDLNTLPQAGDVVILQNPLNLATWQLRDQVRYLTGGIPIKVSLITDGGVSVNALVLGGSQYVSTSRFASITGPASKVTLEMDLLSQGSPGTSILVGNGAVVHHRGVMNGQGGVGVNVSGTAQYFFEGECQSGGGYLVLASGSAKAVLKPTNVPSFGFRAAIQASGTSDVSIHSGLTYVPGNSYALTYAAIIQNTATVRFKSGMVYSADRPAVLFEGAGSLYVSTAATVSDAAGIATGNDLGRIYRHAGGGLEGEPGLPVIELPSDAPVGGGGGPTYTAGTNISISGTTISATFPRVLGLSFAIGSADTGSISVGAKYVGVYTTLVSVGANTVTPYKNGVEAVFPITLAFGDVLRADIIRPVGIQALVEFI